MLTSDLDYELPPELIGTQPAEPRDSARLMIIDRATQRITHAQVRDLATVPGPPSPLRPGDLLIFNQSKVIPARFVGVRHGTGGLIDGLCLATAVDDVTDWQVMLESRGRLRTGETITLAPDAHLELTDRLGGGQWRARLHSAQDGLTLLERIGSPPLPPYIRKARKDLRLSETTHEDRHRYNTVFARDLGSVAAPTAGLHFTPELMATLHGHGIHLAYVTLHVGLGTFAPVRSHHLEAHEIHSERLCVPVATLDALRHARDLGNRIIPIGTTSVRALESLPEELPSCDYHAETSLFITPDTSFEFRFADGMMTNFHLPRSTLLALVAALPDVGLDRLKAWYQHAIDERYRFYSYGDAMLLI